MTVRAFRRLLAALAVFGLVVCASASAFTFSAGSSPLSGEPSAIATVPDPAGTAVERYLVARRAEDRVTVLGAIGQAPFGADVGDAPVAVAAGKLDGDAYTDAVVADDESSTISVLFGKPGGFEAAITIAVGARPRGVAVADMDNDADADVVAVTEGNSTGAAVLLRQTAPRKFDNQTVYHLGARPRAVALGDVDGDARNDILVANYAGSASVYASRTRETHHFPLPSNSPAGVVVADVLGDVTPEIVVANYSHDTVWVLARTGTSPLSFTRALELATGDGPVFVAAADLNSDGRREIFTADQLGKTVSLFRADGDRSFAPRQALSLGAGPRGIAAGFFDADRDVDLATANPDGPNVTVLMNTSRPEPVAEPAALDLGGQPVGVAGEPAHVAVTNRGDGAWDVAQVAVEGRHAVDYSVVGTNCSGTRLGRDRACTVWVRFAPGDAGPREAVLRIVGSSSEDSVSVPLRGHGRASEAAGGAGQPPSPAPGMPVTPTSPVPPTAHPAPVSKEEDAQAVQVLRCRHPKVGRRRHSNCSLRVAVPKGTRSVLAKLRRAERILTHSRHRVRRRTVIVRLTSRRRLSPGAYSLQLTFPRPARARQGHDDPGADPEVGRKR